MKKALGHLTVALVFGAVWPFLAGGHDPALAGNRFEWLLRVLGQVLSPERDLTTIVLVLALVAGQYLSIVGLAALLEPLGRAVLGLQPRRRSAPGLLASTSSFANASAAGDRVRPAG